jgi:hypothetical protein
MEKIEIWLTLAREKYPSIAEDDLKAMSMNAAADWFSNAPTALADLFDQYVMMKQLYGVDDKRPLDIR